MKELRTYIDLVLCIDIRADNGFKTLEQCQTAFTIFFHI